MLAALKSENTSLRAYVTDLLAAVVRLEHASEVDHSAARRKVLRLVEGSATRVAALETEVACNRAALTELVSTSEALSRDNVMLSSQVAALEAAKTEAGGQLAAAGERVSALQELLMRQVGTGRKPSTAAQRLQCKVLQELATPTVLAATAPPPEYPRGGASTSGNDVRPLLQESSSLRSKNRSQEKELQRLRRRVSELEDANADLSEESRSARLSEQRTADESRTQMVGALRRLQFVTEARDDLQRRLRDQAAYVHRIENKLLAVARRRGGSPRPVRTLTGLGSDRQRAEKEEHFSDDGCDDEQPAVQRAMCSAHMRAGGSEDGSTSSSSPRWPHDFPRSLAARAGPCVRRT